MKFKFFGNTLMFDVIDSGSIAIITKDDEVQWTTIDELRIVIEMYESMNKIRL